MWEGYVFSISVCPQRGGAGPVSGPVPGPGGGALVQGSPGPVSGLVGGSPSPRSGGGGGALHVGDPPAQKK